MDLRVTPLPPPYILNGEFFEIISQEGESVTVRCCYCEGNRNIFKGSVRSTGNFHMHIKRKHPELIPKVNESKLRAFLSRKSMQQSRFASAKQKYIKTEGNQLDVKLVPIKAEVQAINLKMGPTAQGPHNMSNVNIKSEPSPYENSKRNIRNSFVPNNLTLSHSMPSNQQLTSSDLFSISHQTEPTNLSQNQRVYAENVLPRIDNTLRSIERELRFRNQIESNRLLLELAKFKYINPDFHFRF